MTYGVKDLRKCVVNHKRIVKLYQEGNAIIEISRLTGYTRTTIKAHLRKAGVYENPWERKGNIYNRDFNKNLEENKINTLLNKCPPPDISDYKNIELICQEEKEKISENILGIGGEELERAREEGIYGLEERGEQEVIEADDAINLNKNADLQEIAATYDQKHIAEIDRVISYVLKLLKDKDRLKRSKTSVLNTIFATMVEKKKMLQGLDPKNKNVDQVIVNFFMNRDFMKEIQKMKALKDKSM